MKAIINSAAKLHWYDLGEGEIPILAVDDFLENADELRAFALTLQFHVPRNGDYYPGLKAYVDLGGSSAMAQWTAEQMLGKLFRPGERPDFVQTQDLQTLPVFSMLACDRSNPPSQFGDQHVDDTCWLATVLHLSLQNESRATAMWEHRPTGLLSWPRSDAVQIHHLVKSLGCNFTTQLESALRKVTAFNTDSLERLIFTRNPRRRPLSADEDEQWKLVGLVPAAFNRLVVYPTWRIHSIVDTTEFSPLTIENARLTLNQFVRFPVARSILPKRTTYPLNFYQHVEGLNL